MRILAVGGVGPDVLDCGSSDGVIAASITDIDAAALANWRPDLIVSPVFDSDFDCLDLAKILSNAGFAGRYRVDAGELPNPGLVRREVSAAFPDLDFDLL
jgi:hypothetical protein